MQPERLATIDAGAESPTRWHATPSRSPSVSPASSTAAAIARSASVSVLTPEFFEYGRGADADDRGPVAERVVAHRRDRRATATAAWSSVGNVTRSRSAGRAAASASASGPVARRRGCGARPRGARRRAAPSRGRRAGRRAARRLRCRTRSTPTTLTCTSTSGYGCSRSIGAITLRSASTGAAGPNGISSGFATDVPAPRPMLAQLGAHRRRSSA